MKKIYLTLLLVFSVAVMAFAHDADSEKRDRMFREVREFKMKYLAQEMELNETQKAKFFPLYEEMSASRDECFHNALRLERKLKKDKNATEEDYQKATEAMTEANAKYAEIEKNYDEKFSEFLSQKQIYKLKEAEKNFREKLEEMKHARKKQKR